MKNWLNISRFVSKNKNFVFTNESTSSVIRIAAIDEDGDEMQPIFMDYDEWEEFCNMINDLNSEMILTTPPKRNGK